MISEEENCGKQKSDNVTAGNNIVDSYYWKCYVRSGRSIISVSVRAADRRNDRYCTFSDRLTGLSVSMFVLGFNIVMLVVGFIFLGKKFAFTTIVSTFTYPICLELFGQGLGSVIRMGTSTGGMDIPPLILNKYFKIPVSVSLNAFDICILLGQAILIPLEMLLYGVILVITYTTVLNKVLLLGGSKMEVKIISRNPEQIRQAIIGHLDRGLTILRAEGGYSQKDRQVLLVVVSNRELHQLERIVKNIDPESFVIVSEVREVSGRGFSLTKEHKSTQRKEN